MPGGDWPVWQQVETVEPFKGPNGGSYVRLQLVCGHAVERRLLNSQRVPTRAHCKECKRGMLRDFAADNRPE